MSANSAYSFSVLACCLSCSSHLFGTIRNLLKHDSKQKMRRLMLQIELKRKIKNKARIRYI